jgi:ribosomal protein S3
LAHDHTANKRFSHTSVDNETEAIMIKKIFKNELESFMIERMQINAMNKHTKVKLFISSGSMQEATSHI